MNKLISSHSAMIKHVEVILAPIELLQRFYNVVFIGQLFFMILTISVLLVTDAREWGQWVRKT